jgi:hypothetical protein
MLLSLPPAPVKNQDGSIWHLQWRAMVARFDEKVNSITKLLTAGTDTPSWTPRPPYVDTPPPPLVDYGYYPDLLQPKNLLILARREFERYLHHRWQTRREQLKGRYPLEARLLKPDVAASEVEEAKRFIQHKINVAALQRWNEDVRELRLHELPASEDYPLPILRGDPVPELDLNKLAVRSLPRLIAQEKEITQKIQSLSQWKLLEPCDLKFVLEQLVALAFPVEEKTNGRLVVAWLKELEQDPEVAHLPGSSAETVALHVSAVINRAILHEWETLKHSLDQVVNTLKHYCAQEIERFVQRFQSEQQNECRRARIPEFAIPVISVVQVKRGQLVEHASRADLAARRLGQLAVVCQEMGWLFRPVVPDPEWWPLRSEDQLRLIRRDPSCDARAKLSEMWHKLRDDEFVSTALLYGPRDKLRQTMRQVVEHELGRLAQLHLDPVVKHYERLWQRDKEEREALCERYRRVHVRATHLCRHLVDQDYPVTAEMARQVLEMMPGKKLQPRDTASLSLGQYLQVPEGVLSTTASARDLALAQYRYWDETPHKTFRQLISLWISQLY